MNYSNFPPALDHTWEMDELLLSRIDRLISRSRLEENIQLELSAQLLKFHIYLQNNREEEGRKSIYQIESIIEVNEITGYCDLNQYYFSLKALFLMRSGNLENAIKHFTKAYDISGEERVIYYLGILHKDRKEYNFALSYFLEGIDLLEEGDPKAHQYYLQIGSVYYIRGQYRFALWYFFNSVENSQNEIATYEKICLCYILLGDLELAKYYLIEFMSSDEKMRSNVILLLISSLIKLQEGEINTSYSILMEVRRMDLDISQELLVTKKLSTIMLLRGDLLSAEKLLQKSISISLEVGNYEELIEVYQIMGRVYYQKGEHETCINFLMDAFNLSLRVNSRMEIISTLFLLIQIKISQKRITSIENYLEIMRTVTDNLDNEISTCYYLLTKALWLEAQNRLIPRAEAQKILRELNAGTVSDFELKFMSKLRLVENLISELSIINSKETYEEILKISAQLIHTGKKIKSPQYLIEALFIKCKINMYNLEFDRAMKILVQIEIICEENDYTKYEPRILGYKKEITNYLKLVNSNELSNVKESMLISEIDDYISLVFTQ